MDDHSEMQGAWDVVELEQDGGPAPDAPLVKQVLIEGDRMTFRYRFPWKKEPTDLEHGFHIPAGTGSKEIELHTDAGACRGVYELTAASLSICWSRTPDVPVPTGFETSPGSDRRLIRLLRKTESA